MSLQKKKLKLDPSTDLNKRASERSDSEPSVSKEDDIEARRNKNFIKACEQVSRRDYFDHRARLLLENLHSLRSICKDQRKNEISIHQMSSYAYETFRFEVRLAMLYEGLLVCTMCITPKVYLSADVLKEVVEMIMNVQEDKYSEPVKYIIYKCQQVLTEHFKQHPPYLTKDLRYYYKNFLTSSMAHKENTYTDRNYYEYNKGVVKYCMNRLEYELSAESKDGPLVDPKIPEEIKKNPIKKLHWEKAECNIFELLNRKDRIERLFAVLETIIELLQSDLVAWQSRFTKDLGHHVMRSHKPMMAEILWSDKVMNTRIVTHNCRQILRIFAHMIHLGYPDTMVKTFTIWLNTMFQTFYNCQSNSNRDYPNTEGPCSLFASDFCTIISVMPYDSINKVLERIKPSFMRHLVGLLHVKKVLSSSEDCIIRILINFLKQAQWKSFPFIDNKINLSNDLFPSPKNVDSKMFKDFLSATTNIETLTGNDQYRKLEPTFERSEEKVSLNQVVHSIYITLEAYLDAYDIKSVQGTWSKLNDQLLDENEMENENVMSSDDSCYSVTESLIERYRNMMQSIRELMDLFIELKNKSELPEVLNIFGTIGLLDLDKI